MLIVRLILLIVAIISGIVWFQTGDFLWYGITCMGSLFLLLCTFAVDVSDFMFFD